MAARKSENLKPIIQGPTIPPAAISRMAIYLRELQQLLRSGVETIKSYELGELLGFTDSQVRRDLALLGTMGRRGVGYQTEAVCQAIRQVIGTDRSWGVVLVGMGNLGQALAGYKGFDSQGFHLVAAFEADPRKVGRTVSGVAIHDLDKLEEIVAAHSVQLAILAVPAPVAANVAERLAKCGIEGILNFAPTTVQPTKTKIPVIDVDLAIELQRLAFAVVNKTTKS
jgi:redox-sensing transcriptional repressor